MLDGSKREMIQKARSLLRVPAFSAVAAVTLTLAIGANTAIFSVVKACCWTRCPSRSDELVVIRGTAREPTCRRSSGSGRSSTWSIGSMPGGFEDLGFVISGQTTVRSGEHVERLYVAAWPPSLYTTLGVKPVLGRLPTMEDEEGQVAVISHWLWSDWFGRDPAVIGNPSRSRVNLLTVVGVLPP